MRENLDFVMKMAGNTSQRGEKLAQLAKKWKRVNSITTVPPRTSTLLATNSSKRHDLARIMCKKTDWETREEIGKGLSLPMCTTASSLSSPSSAYLRNGKPTPNAAVKQQLNPSNSLRRQERVSAER